MADYSDLDPTTLRRSLSDGTRLKKSITTALYTGGTPSAANQVKPSIMYPDGTLKESVTYADGTLKPSWLIAGGGGGTWTPADITTKGWWDASDATTITEAANAVSQWDDKSPEAEPLIQGWGANQPTINANTINGLQTITFNGTTNSLYAASTVFGPTIDNVSLFLVTKTLSFGTGSICNLNGLAGNASWKAVCPYSDGKIYFDNGGITAPNRISAASGISVNDEDMISFATGTNLQEIRLNGTQIASDTTVATLNTWYGIRIGSDNTFFQHCAIGEVIIIEGDVSVSDRQKIEGYLAHKWGQESQLDAGHPYKSAAP